MSFVTQTRATAGKPATITLTTRSLGRLFDSLLTRKLSTATGIGRALGITPQKVSAIRRHGK